MKSALPAFAIPFALIFSTFLLFGSVRADACCMVTCDQPVCECERVLNTNNCGNRTTCQPAACGDAKAQTLGTKLAFGATNTDAWASEHVKESLAERDNTEVEGHADLEAYA